MRWFWLFILTLILLTTGLYVMRINQSSTIEINHTETSRRPSSSSARDRRVINEETPNQKAEQVAVSDAELGRESVLDAEVVEVKDQNKTHVEVQHSDQIDGTQEDASETNVVDEVESDVSEIEKTTEQSVDHQDELSDHESQSTSGTDLEPEAMEEANDGIDLASEQENKPEIELSLETEPVDNIPVGAPEGEIVIENAPDFEQLADGSIRVLESGKVIEGQGTIQKPYIVDWLTLRSIERGFNPKEKRTELPEWLGFLDGKQVKIIGNTLVPVIATTTRELLVMQNPWDGCCIGIPPSPYDAIEVTLNHDVDFGSSAVGFGTVEGEFVLDPYVVDGWVLGLYIIDNATYRSGEGIAFPDF